MTSTDPSDLISQADAARLRNVSRQAISQLIASGRLIAVHVAGKALLRRSDVMSFTPNQAGRPKGNRNGN